MSGIHRAGLGLALGTLLVAVPSRASAGPDPRWPAVRFDAGLTSPAPAASPRFVIRWDAVNAALGGEPRADGVQTSRPPVAFAYSHAYDVRDRVHKIASFAMLPLFGAEAYLGQRLLTDPHSRGTKSAHGVVATAIVGLFAVNTVTGVWNLVEGRKDPHRGTRPVVHAILMLAADAGFVATTFTGPKSRTAAQLANFPNTSRLHKTLAYASISTATVGYLIMLFR